MKTIKAVVLFCTFFLALGAFAVQQTPAAHEGTEGHGKADKSGKGDADLDQHIKVMSEKLNLSADQQTKLRAIMVETHQQARAIMNDTSLSKEEKHSKMQSAHEAGMAKAHEIMNDEQRQKFDQMVKDMQQQQGMHGHGDHDHDHDKGEHNPK